MQQHSRMAKQHGSLSVAQVRILRALSCGGMLTEHQIKVSVGLTEWKTRHALANLVSHELIVTGARRGRYEITQRGRKTLTTEASASPQA
jgi:predicted transcriptional regulator